MQSNRWTGVSNSALEVCFLIAQGILNNTACSHSYYFWLRLPFPLKNKNKTKNLAGSALFTGITSVTVARVKQLLKMNELLSCN